MLPNVAKGCIFAGSSAFALVAAFSLQRFLFVRNDCSLPKLEHSLFDENWIKTKGR